MLKTCHYKLYNIPALLSLIEKHEVTEMGVQVGKDLSKPMIASIASSKSGMLNHPHVALYVYQFYHTIV